MTSPITHLRALELGVTDLERSAAFYEAAYGLTVRDRGDDALALTCDGGQTTVLRLVPRAERRLTALDFVLGEGEDAESLASRIERGGHEANVENGVVRTATPDGLTLRVHPFDPKESRTENADRPNYLSHVVLNVLETGRSIAFFTDALGFTISDAYEKELLTFLRSDQPQHHCVGVSPGEVAGLNHFAMDCRDVDGVMAGVGRMKRAGFEPVWGPGRHGPGGNVFAYFEDPDGFVAEFTSDVMEIHDEEHEARVWPRTPENANSWGTGGPTERSIALMSGKA